MTANERQRIDVFPPPGREPLQESWPQHNRHGNRQRSDRSIDLRIRRPRRRIEPDLGRPPRCIRTACNGGPVDMPAA